MTIPSLEMNDGRSIPQIGFGLWQVPNDVAMDTTTQALQDGYRHIDSAAAYENEAGVRVAMERVGLPRNEVFVTTKVWNNNHGFDETLRAFDQSMALLGLDELDLYLVHWPAPAINRYVESWKALIALREEGRVRSIGVSNFKVHHLQRIIDEFGIIPAINQIELQPWLPQKELRAFHDAQGILTEAWSPLASGELIDDPLLASIGAKHGKSTAQVMIRWHLQIGNVVLPKSVTPSRIRENLEVFDFSLDAEDMARIDTLDCGRRTGPDPDDFNVL